MAIVACYAGTAVLAVAADDDDDDAVSGDVAAAPSAPAPGSQDLVGRSN
jgi:hypothetical protein